MTYYDLSVKEFVEKLGSGDPTPGGGGSSALNAALGIALTKMVTEFTVGKKRYAEHNELNERVLKEAEDLMNKFLQGIEDDRQAFDEVGKVYAMPRGTEEEKEARRVAMQEATLVALKPPFDLMELCVEALKVTEEIVGKSNPNVASDVGVAAVQLKGALQSSWVSVVVNLGILKDEDLKAKYQERGEALLAEGSEIAERVYEAIIEQVK